MPEKRLRLIYDLDAIAFKACSAAEKDVDWGDGLWSVYTQEADIVACYENIIQQHREAVRKHYSLKEFKAAEIVFVLSVGDNWRIKYEPTYKASRRRAVKINRKPVGYYWLLNYVQQLSDVRWRDGYEGDDVAGILATSETDKYENVIVALDKDFKTIPCKFIRLTDGHLYDLDRTEAFRNLMLQTLSGDVTDGYPGCEGIGAVKAARILKDLKYINEMEFATEREFSCVEFKKLFPDLTLKQFCKEGFEEETKAAMIAGEDAYLRQYYLARILKSGDRLPEEVSE
ncbi:hypothetical protein [Chromobacterium haemolyticum]|uniref:hypothetical protein n=1 Tax=Chromobacterium haemolyticum TaxID=394935 RepID=UPI000D31A13B|nr:hypothetical protein [Chromobacterium haemolyticum]PTU68617.1 hypothetical protein DBB33_03745 [Chromobacterium haemolyticum]